MNDQILKTMKSREKQILEMISIGQTTKEISEALYLNFETIKTYRTQLLKKFGARNAAHLVYVAVRGGYLTAIAFLLVCISVNAQSVNLFPNNETGSASISGAGGNPLGHAQLNLYRGHSDANAEVSFLIEQVGFHTTRDWRLGLLGTYGLTSQDFGIYHRTFENSTSGVTEETIPILTALGNHTTSSLGNIGLGGLPLSNSKVFINEIGQASNRMGLRVNLTADNPSDYAAAIKAVVSGDGDDDDYIAVFGEATSNEGSGRSIGVVGYGGDYDFFATGPGTNFGSGSSIRWKRNVENIDGALDKLNALRGVYFIWDEDHGGKKDIGFIAEEVGKILPEIVEYEANGIDAHGMDYAKITPLLVEAINELAKKYDLKIRELEKEIETLKKHKK